MNAIMKNACLPILTCIHISLTLAAMAEDFPRPYSPPCVERENVFEFTAKPRCQYLGDDKYEITFAVKGFCDVTVAIVDPDPAKELVQGRGVVVRHLASGVLGANAPPPFQKNSLKQTILWDGKDDLGAYPREPDKLSVQVRLGLKPEFNRRLGVTNPKGIPGNVWGVCADETGIYVLSGADGIIGMRKFDSDGNYACTVFPPPANQPQEKLQGLGFVEYAPGKRTLQTPDLVSTWGEPTAGSLPNAPGYKYGISCQPTVVDGRIYYITPVLSVRDRHTPFSWLYHVGCDGSTERQGLAGRNLQTNAMARPNLAASPDGRWLYFAGDDESRSYSETLGHVVHRVAVTGEETAGVFAGKPGVMGTKAGLFNQACGLACDGQGRVYVCDHLNGRIQVFSPAGQFLKAIPVDRPMQIHIHRKTDAIYVMHAARVEGRSVNRISKFSSFDEPKVESHFEPPVGLMALDSWSAKPRIWLAGKLGGRGGNLMAGRFEIVGANVTIWEEDGKNYRKFADFEEEVKQEAGGKRVNAWHGGGSSRRKVACDPVRCITARTGAHGFLI